MLSGSNALRKLLLFSAAFGGIAFSHSAMAQTQGAASNSSSGVTTDVQEVVVTANKRNERLRDVAMDVTAVTGNDLQTRQELDFTEFAAEVPGFNVQTAGIGGANREILRGQNSGGAGATVATVIDEMPLSFSGSDNNAGLTSTNPDTYDLQRVEVLKGPQGTLYGAAAEGGVVKFVTNPPDTTAFHAGAELGGDTVDHGGIGGSGKAYVNIPFWQDKAALRLTGYYEDIPGYVGNPYLNEHDVNRADRFGFRASLLLKPTSDLTIRLTAAQQDVHEFGFDAEQVPGTGLGANTSPSRLKLDNGYNFSTYTPNTDKNIVDYYIGDIEYDLHWARLTSITSFGMVKNSYIRDFTPLEVAPGLSYGNYFGNLLYGAPVGLTDKQLESLSKVNQEFRISSEPGATLFGHKIDWVGGGFLTREDVDFNQFLDFVTLPTVANPGTVLTAPAAGDAHYPSRFEEAALFGQVDFHLTPRIDIAVGGRAAYDVEQLQITFFTGALEGAGGQEPKYKNHEQPDTWSVSPRWQITDNTTAYLRFATGYRPGGPNLAPPNPPVGYNYNYQSDSTMNYEGGIRSELFHHSVTIDLAAFYIDWSNIQILTLFTTPGGVSYGATGNAGAATSKGVEYNFGWRPLQGLSFSWLGAYTDAELTQNAPGLGAMKGQALSYVPKWSNTLNGDYQWTIAEGYKGFVGGTVLFEGSRFTDFGTFALNDPHAKLPSYETVSLQGGVKTGPYTFEAYAKNVTNSRGIVGYTGSGGFNGDGFVSLITPLTVGFRAAVDY